jgi:hypothetical protein
MSASLPVTPAVRERPILFSGPMVKAILAGTKTQTRRVLTPPPPTAEAVCAKSGSGFDLFTDRSTPGEYRVAGPVWAVRDLMDGFGGGHGPRWRCPYGAPGDRLWVRETWQCYVLGKNDLLAPTPRPALCSIGYAATEDTRVGTAPDFARYEGPWRPSIFMPRWASRMTLEITDVRVQRLQEITVEDVQAEGIRLPCRVPDPAKPTEVIPLLRVTGTPSPREFSSKRAEDWTAEDYWRHAFAHEWNVLNGKRAPWATNPWVWAISFRRAA